MPCRENVPGGRLTVPRVRRPGWKLGYFVCRVNTVKHKDTTARAGPPGMRVFKKRGAGSSMNPAHMRRDLPRH